MIARDEYPWGIHKMTLHTRDEKMRIVIYPESPKSVTEGLRMLAGKTIDRVVSTPKENPKYEEWVEAVKNRETRLSLADWSGE